VTTMQDFLRELSDLELQHTEHSFGEHFQFTLNLFIRQAFDNLNDWSKEGLQRNLNQVRAKYGPIVALDIIAVRAHFNFYGKEIKNAARVEERLWEKIFDKAYEFMRSEESQKPERLRAAFPISVDKRSFISVLEMWCNSVQDFRVKFERTEIGSLHASSKDRPGFMLYDCPLNNLLRIDQEIAETWRSWKRKPFEAVHGFLLRKTLLTFAGRG